MNTEATEPAREPESFEELRAVYDAAVESAASLRNAITQLRAPYDEEIARIEERWFLENSELLKEEAAQAHLAQLTEQELRKAILAAYAMDRTNKQIAPHLGLSVQARKEFVIINPTKMREWAEAHTDFLINEPDEKAIKEAAKNEGVRRTLKMDTFIEIREKPVAVIGKLIPGPDGEL